MVIVIISVLAITTFLLDLYFYSTVKKRIELNKYIKIAYWAIWSLPYLIVLLRLVISNFSSVFSGSDITIYMSLCSSIIIVQLLSKFIYLIVSLPTIFIKNKKLSNCIIITAAVAMILIWGWSIKANWNTNNPTITNYKIVSNKIPNSFNGYKIVFFADSHLGIYGKDTTILVKVKELVDEINPDLILFGGDMVVMSSEEMIPFISGLSTLKSKDGKYSVLGNHDYGLYLKGESEEEKNNNRNRLIQYEEQGGFNLLMNSNIEIKRGDDIISLVGVENWGEKQFGQMGDIEKALEGVNSNNYTILISHNSEHYKEIIKGNYPIDLTLSGHTHAMQFEISLFNKIYSPSSWIYQYWNGKYEDDKQTLIVTRGLGATAMKLRYGARAELVCIELSNE